MKCPKCKFENRKGAKFCKDCGANLVFTSLISTKKGGHSIFWSALIIRAPKARIELTQKKGTENFIPSAGVHDGSQPCQPQCSQR
jgi:hypothetical protein